MATEVIHEHHSGSDNSAGIVIGIVLLIVFALLLFYFLGNGLFQGMSGRGTNIQVPDKVDVNVQGGQGAK